MAQYMLGYFYIEGLGVPKNESIGKTWQERAKQNGFVPPKGQKAKH